MAFALNNSSNPVKALKTIMRDPDVVKAGRKYTFNQMLTKFVDRLEARANEEKEIADSTQRILDSIGTGGQTGGDTDFSPEDFHDGFQQPDKLTDEKHAFS